MTNVSQLYTLGCIMADCTLFPLIQYWRIVVLKQFVVFIIICRVHGSNLSLFVALFGYKLRFYVYYLKLALVLLMVGLQIVVVLVVFVVIVGQRIHGIHRDIFIFLFQQTANSASTLVHIDKK